ncbi:MAG: hypothetical protein WCP31_08095, partial [Chloroflexales bacterium]
QKAIGLPVAESAVLCSWYEVARIGFLVLGTGLAGFLLWLLLYAISSMMALPKGFISLSNDKGIFQDPIPVAWHGKREPGDFIIIGSYGRIKVYVKRKKMWWRRQLCTIKRTRQGTEVITVITNRYKEQHTLERAPRDMDLERERKPTTRIRHGLLKDRIDFTIRAQSMGDTQRREP